MKPTGIVTRSRSHSACSNSSNTSDQSAHSNSSRGKRLRESPNKHPQTNKRSKVTMEAKLAAISQKLDSILLTNAHNQPNIDAISTILQNQESFNMQLKDLGTKVNAIEERISGTENALTDLYVEINHLKTHNQQLAVEMNKVQQENLNHHFVIRNLPPGLSKDSASKILQKIATSTSFTLESKDFLIQPYPLQQRDKKTSHIIGAFYDIRKKQNFLSKFKAARPIPVEDVCDELPEDSVFRGKEIGLGNQLTRMNRSLLYHARQHRDIFEFAWENNGRVLLRQKAGAPTNEVTSLGHLELLINRTRRDATNVPSHMRMDTTNRNY